MGEFSIWHLIIIAVIVLLLFGPNRLPKLGKSVGEAIRGFKKGLNGDEIDVSSRASQDQIPSGDQQQTINRDQVNREQEQTVHPQTDREKNKV